MLEGVSAFWACGFGLGAYDRESNPEDYFVQYTGCGDLNRALGNIAVCLCRDYKGILPQNIGSTLRNPVGTLVTPVSHTSKALLFYIKP